MHMHAREHMCKHTHMLPYYSSHVSTGLCTHNYKHFLVTAAIYLLPNPCSQARPRSLSQVVNALHPFCSQRAQSLPRDMVMSHALPASAFDTIWAPAEPTDVPEAPVLVK